MSTEDTNGTLLTQENTDGADNQDDKSLEGDDKSLEGDDKSLEGDDKSLEGDDKSAKGSPEEYETFTIPDKSPLLDSQIEDMKVLAKDLDLTQEQAQKIVDAQAKSAQEFVDKQYETFANIKEGWADEVKADKEIGGADYQEKVSDAVKALGRFGSDGLRTLLEETGIGNHPEMVRLFYTISKEIKEDTFVEGGAPAPAKPFFEKSNHV